MTDQLELFLNEIGITAPDERQALEGQILSAAFKRALVSMAQTLSDADKATIQAFLTELNDEARINIEALIAQPAYRAGLTEAFADVVGELINDPAVVPPDKRDELFAKLEAAAQTS